MANKTVEQAICKYEVTLNAPQDVSHEIHATVAK